jgi:hypothetical protein
MNNLNFLNPKTKVKGIGKKEVLNSRDKKSTRYVDVCTVD